MSMNTFFTHTKFTQFSVAIGVALLIYLYAIAQGLTLNWHGKQQTNERIIPTTIVVQPTPTPKQITPITPTPSAKSDFSTIKVQLPTAQVLTTPTTTPVSRISISTQATTQTPNVVQKTMEVASQLVDTQLPALPTVHVEIKLP